MRNKKNLGAQLNLPLCETPPMALPQDKQQALAVALADLLWKAALAAEAVSGETPGDHA